MSHSAYTPSSIVKCKTCRGIGTICPFKYPTCYQAPARTPCPTCRGSGLLIATRGAERSPKR